MSNRPSICWKCIHRENCRHFNPEVNVTDCGRFLMPDGEKALYDAIFRKMMVETQAEGSGE